MDPFEKAIRNAFEKGDASDRAYREKVYRSAFAALERALQSNAAVTPDIAARRKQMLSTRISEIESEFIPAVAPSRPAAASAAPDFAVDPVSRPAAASGAAAPTLGGMARGNRPVSAPVDDDIEPPSYGEYAPRQRRRRPWLSILVTVFILAALGIGAWWLLAPGPRDPGFPTSPPMDSEDFSPESPPLTEAPPSLSGDSLADWIHVFEPGDAATVTAPGDSRAELMQEDGRQFIRITSGNSGSPILFDVRQGVLEEIAGSRAIFNIVARDQEGVETQMSVECSLADLGDCGRKRYAVGDAEEEFLFEIDLPAVNPGAGGTIAINPDIEGSGRSVDIFAIRVTATAR